MRVLVLSVLAAVVVAGVSVAYGAPVSVVVRDDVFEPDQTRAVVGQTVEWTTASSATDAHNVREDRRIFYSGPAFETEFTYSRVFSAGTFHYFCERHGFRRGGMDGTVKVPVVLTAAPKGPDFTVRWAASDSNTGSRYTVQYKIGSGSWKNWKSSTRALKATFSLAEPGKRYTFRAKSMKGDDASKWSPVASIST